MAGHSKWSQIKRKKAILDSKRGKAFTKLIKEITVAAKIGGADHNANPRLNTLLEKAKSINMPQDNVSRALKKGTGELPGVSYESYLYEGYGPGGIAVLIEVLTDNKNRSIAELRHAFSIKGGNLAETGSVNWMFEKMGVIKGDATGINQDAILEKLLDYQINDISFDDDLLYATTDMKALEIVKQALLNEKINIESAEIEWVAQNKMKPEEQELEKALDFLNYIEDLDDVQNIYTNLE